jgi:ribosomally synthesized peptide (two-chain TOMM family)
MPRDNRLPTYESLLEFQEVYVRAVALTWTDPVFKQEFIQNPTVALEKFFGFRATWNVELEIKEADQPGQGWDPATKSWNLPPLECSFGLPEKPVVEEQLLAFAAYNDAGPTYLFTCC